MKFTYCPLCGQALSERIIGDEGLTPYCESCSRPYFDWIPTCTITVVTDEEDRVLVAKQQPVDGPARWGLIAGYMKKGENAETSATREIAEETGQSVDSIEFVKSYYFDRRELLMLGFHAKVKASDLVASVEIEALSWVTAPEAVGLLADGSIAKQLVEEVYGYGHP